MSMISRSATDESCFSLTNVPLRKMEVEGLKVEVPTLLVDCFECVLSKCLVEGIFRIPGSVKRMRDVTADYTSYQAWLEEASPSPHDVSGVIKKFTRNYLHSIGGLFRPQVLDSLRTHISLNKEKYSELGSESYQSLCASQSSGFRYAIEEYENLTEESESVEFAKERSPKEILDSIATLLVSCNSSRKNVLFIYFLSQLKCVSEHREQTRMPNANLAIVFQQYLFETLVVAELQSFQILLEFLLENFEAFVAKYRSTLALLGSFEDTFIKESGSASNTDLMSFSPLTDTSSPHISNPRIFRFGSRDVNKRSSLSKRLNSLWTAYYTPANRSKRFSFMSRASQTSTSRSKKNNGCSSPTDEHLFFLKEPKITSQSAPASDNDKSPLDSESDSDTTGILRYLSNTSHLSDQVRLSYHETKRKRFSQLVARDSISASDLVAATPRTPPIADLPSITPPQSFIANFHSHCLPQRARRVSTGRTFSIWSRRD